MSSLLLTTSAVVLIGCVTSPEPAPAEPATSESTTTPERDVILYRVQPGDSMWTIAEKFYGDPAKAHWIQSANPSIDPRKIQIGETLRVPRLQGTNTPPAAIPR